MGVRHGEEAEQHCGSAPTRGLMFSQGAGLVRSAERRLARRSRTSRILGWRGLHLFNPDQKPRLVQQWNLYLERGQPLTSEHPNRVGGFVDRGIDISLLHRDDQSANPSKRRSQLE